MAHDHEFSRQAEIVRRMKQDKVAQHGDSPDESDSDIMSFCAGVRGSKQLFVVYHGEGTQAARQCAFWTSLFLSCDEIFLIADARFKVYPALDDSNVVVPRSPEQVEEELRRSHPEIGPGFLGEAWERGERQGIQECIVIQRHPLAGPPTLAFYEYERKGRKLIWGKIRLDNPDLQTGAIHDAVAQARRKRREIQPQIDEMVAGIQAKMAQEDFPPDERVYWTDRGMALNVSGRPGVHLVHYLSPYPHLPDAIFHRGQEVDPETWEPTPSGD